MEVMTQAGAEPVDGLIDGVEGLVGDLGLPILQPIRVPLDEGLAGAGLMSRTLLGPLALPRLDGDEAVGGDAVPPA